MGGCPGAADPAVASRYVPRIDGVQVDGGSEPPALAFEEQLADFALELGQVIGGHLADGFRRKQSVTFDGSFAEDHLGKPEPVVDRSDETSGSSRNAGR